MAGSVKQVMLIDDDRDFAFLLEKSFRARGVTLTAACTAAEGLETLRNSNPDVLLLDQLLPDTNGADILSAIREIKPNLPVIMLTCLGEIPLVVRTIQSGAVDYILKPVGHKELWDRIQKIVEAPRKEAPQAEVFSFRDRDYQRLVSALESTAGNITQTAKLLGVGRDTVYRKMKKFHITTKKLESASAS